MRDWQEKQYLPGAYTGSDIPFPTKQFGKKKGFRVFAIVWLILFSAFVVYGLVNMILSIMNNP